MSETPPEIPKPESEKVSHAGMAQEVLAAQIPELEKMGLHGITEQILFDTLLAAVRKKYRGFSAIPGHRSLWISDFHFDEARKLGRFLFEVRGTRPAQWHGILSFTKVKKLEVVGGIQTGKEEIIDSPHWELVSFSTMKTLARKF